MFELRPFDHRSNRAMRTYDPLREMEDLERAFFGRPFNMDRSFAGLAEFKTDIQDKGDSFLLEADLPGFKKEDIHVDLDGERLTVTAERHSDYEQKEKKGNYIRCERSYGTYARSFDTTGIDTANIKASYQDGILKLTLPKKTELPASARRLEIE